MKKRKGLFEIEARDNGDDFWNGVPDEKSGGIKIKINDNVFHISDNLQKVLIDTSNIPLKKIKDEDREIYKNILEAVDFENCKPIRGETKRGRYK